MTEPSSRLTVKVRLHPAQPPEPAMPAPAPLSKFRLLLALAGFAGLAALGFQLLAQKRPPDQANSISQSPQPASTSAVQISVPAATHAVMQAPAQTAVNATAQIQHTPPGDTALSQPQQHDVTDGVAVQTAAAVVTAPPDETTTGLQSVKTQGAAMDYPAGFSRIVLTAAMRNLEPGAPAGQQIRYPDIQRLYLFTELKDYAGQTLRHRWYWQGKLHTEAVLTIEDSPWRTYSENWLLDNQRGDWRVQIVDQTEKVIFEYSFTYQ